MKVVLVDMLASQDFLETTAMKGGYMGKCKDCIHSGECTPQQRIVNLLFLDNEGKCYDYEKND